MRRLYWSNEKHFESCKWAIGNTRATESRFVACVTISAESELVVEDRGKGDVLPVKRPVPVARVGLLR